MPQLPDLRDELLTLVAGDPEEAASRLAQIVDAHGWPGLRLVGPEAADAAWSIARRAVGSRPECGSWLPPLHDAAVLGEADPRHFATLADAVAAAAGDPQPYGTLATLAADGEVEFSTPLADPPGLQARRDELGLPSLATDAPYLATGLVPRRPDRGSVPVNQWPMLVEGHVSVIAALRAGVRPIHRIWATRPGHSHLGRLRAVARERGVTIDRVEPALVDELVRGRTHGGVVGLVGARRPIGIDQLLVGVGESPVVVLLDGIEDPFNFGGAVRALYAAGIEGLVVTRSWETALPVITRSSGGATELMPTAWARSTAEAVEAARAAGLRIVVADAGPHATDLHSADLRGGILLLIGGERRGVARSARAEVNDAVRIGYGRPDAPPLGTAAAAAVIGFEIRRQRA